MLRSRYAVALALALVTSFLLATGAMSQKYPVTVGAGSSKITLAKKPVRIVSLSPSTTEMLYAIGAGKQVIAVDDQSNYPAKAPRTKLSGFAPNVEAIAKYKPDLVIGEAGLAKYAGQLRTLGIPVLVQPSATSLADAYAQIRVLGRATGHQREATRLVTRMKTQIAAAVRSVPKRSKPLFVYHEVDPAYYSATSKTFSGAVYKLFGLRNIADAADKTRTGYPQLSAEYIVSANPGLIVLADGQTPAMVSKRSGWSGIAAVQQRAVVAVNPDVAQRWGPRVVTFVRIVAKKLRSL